MAGHPDGDYDRDILDIIPERFDADPDSYHAQAGHRLRNWLLLGGGVAAVGLVVAFGLHMISRGSGSGSGVPVIAAEDRPIKVRPDDRGGMQVPNQDKLVYGRLEQSEMDGKVEHLLPGAEQPVPVPPGGDAPRPAAPAQPEVLAPPPLPKVSALAPNAPAAGAALPAPAVVMPKPVEPVAMPKPVEPVAAPKPAEPVALSKPAEPVRKITPVVPATLPPNPPPKAAEPVKKPTQLAAAAPAAAPKPAPAPVPATIAAPAKAPAPAITGGDYLVQLGALRSAADADKEWSRIQRANGDLLAGLKSDVVQVDLGAKGVFWRLRAGHLSEASARHICTELKSRSQGCIVAHK